MKTCAYYFKNQVDCLNLRGVILTTLILVLTVSLNAQIISETTKEKGSDEPAVDVVINESMINNFNQVEYNDKQAGLQELIKNHDLEEVGLILQTLDMEEISKATSEELKNVASVNKSSMQLQTIKVKPLQKKQSVASVQ
ncbi:MAG: hypothetical protein JW894_16610 [Bacteroidales bacterium]|nr:hypothetical protein [Bacteroidales bacterium]